MKLASVPLGKDNLMMKKTQRNVGVKKEQAAGISL